MMTRKLLTLTDSQVARMVEFREEWMRIGLSTDPADRPRAEKAIVSIYRAGGHKLPKKIVWCGSPLGITLTRFLALHSESPVDTRVRASAQLRALVGPSVWEAALASAAASDRAPLWRSVRSFAWKSAASSVGEMFEGPTKALLKFSLPDPVDASLRAKVDARAIVSVRAAIRQPVFRSVVEQVRRPLESAVWASLRDAGRMLGSLYGQHDAGWLASYRYFREVCGLRTETEQLVGAWELAASAGWTLPGLGVCWISERHSSLTRDSEGRLHNLSGPSVVFPDGWSVYAVRGVRVPAAWIENKGAFDPTTALTWENIEQRRAAAEIVGWGKIIQALSPLTIHAHPNPEIGTLLRCDLPDAPRQQFLRVKCGTGREFVLPVPPDVTTALEANAWTYGLRPEEYALEART